MAGNRGPVSEKEHRGRPPPRAWRIGPRARAAAGAHAVGKIRIYSVSSNPVGGEIFLGVFCFFGGQKIFCRVEESRRKNGLVVVVVFWAGRFLSKKKKRSIDGSS